MPAAVPGSAVTVSIVRDPALVRTVRLVAAAVARRTGLDEDFVEEVRLAAGEACALLLGDDSDPSDPEPVTVAIAIDKRLSVEVRSESAVHASDSAQGDIDGVEPWALLRGLIDDFDVVQNGQGTRVSMSWPVA